MRALTPPVLALLALALTGCPKAPPPPLAPGRPANMRIEAVTEDQDEWLHAHCTFRHTATIGSEEEAVAAATGYKANFVEPLFRTTSTEKASENGVTTVDLQGHVHHVILFSCKENPPW